MLKGLVCLGLLTTWAAAADDGPRELAAKLGAKNTEALCHRWAAPEWAPWDMRSLQERTLEQPADPVVHGERAIVAGSNLVLWLKREQGRWGFVGWRKDLAISLEWLYQDGKKGTAALPEDAMDAFLEAIRANDPAAAERQCTHEAWVAPRFGLREVFSNTRKGEADLRRIALRQRNRKAHMLVAIVQRAKTRGEFYVLAEKLEEAWLLSGVVEKGDAADRFLTAKPFSPATAAALRDALAKAVADRAPWRLRRLRTAIYGKSFDAVYLAGPLAPGELQAGERRAIFPVHAGKTMLLCAKRREGWRVDGHTSDAAHARKFLAGEAPARK